MPPEIRRFLLLIIQENSIGQSYIHATPFRALDVAKKHAEDMHVKGPYRFEIYEDKGDSIRLEWFGKSGRIEWEEA